MNRNRTRAVAACEYCIDGMIPAGYHLDLGPVYQRCPFCIALGLLPPCRECDDTAMFPANFTCLHCLAEALAEHGLLAAICPSCTGVTYTTATEAGEL
jgi:hypothetical protein